MKIVAAYSMSLDGFIDGPPEPGAEGPQGRGAAELFRWLRSGDTPSRVAPHFKLSAASARFFDESAGRAGAVISGRRTYDVSDAWGGGGPFGPAVPLFVVTHRVPENVPVGKPRFPGGPSPAPYTFVTEGIESAVEKARAAAAGKDIALMGANIVQQCLRAGLVDELVINLVPVVLGRGVRLLDGLEPGSVTLELAQVVDAPDVTHLRYSVKRSWASDRLDRAAML